MIAKTLPKATVFWILGWKLSVERVLYGVFACLEFFYLFIDDRNKGKNS